MHEKEVGRIFLLTDLLGNTCCHRNGGNTCGTDERVDLVLGGNEVHQLCEQNAACRTETECDNTHDDDLDGVKIQEVGSNGGCTDGDTEEDGDDVHQFVLCGLAETFADTAFLPEVTEHQTADQRCCGRNEEGNEDGNNDREQDLFGLGNGAERGHLDQTLFLGGEELHDRRLDDGNERHVGVSRNSDRTEQIGEENGGGVDRGRTVSTADDTDGSSSFLRETEEDTADKGCENTDLSRCTEEQGLRICDQRSKVCHCTDTDEDQTGVNTSLDSDVKVVEQTAVCKDCAVVVIICMTFGHEVVPQVCVVHFCAGQVGKKHTECDTEQQKRFKLLDDRQVHEQQRNENHNQVAPGVAEIGKQLVETGLFHKVQKCVHEVDLLSVMIIS